MPHKLPYLFAPFSGLPSCLVIQAICPLAEGASLHPFSTLFPQTPPVFFLRFLNSLDTSHTPFKQVPVSFCSSPPPTDILFANTHRNCFSDYASSLHFNAGILNSSSKLGLSKCLSFKHSIYFACQHSQPCSESTKTVGTGKVPITAQGRVTVMCHSLGKHTMCSGPHMLRGQLWAVGDINSFCISPFKEISTHLKVFFDPVKPSGLSPATQGPNASLPG